MGSRLDSPFLPETAVETLLDLHTAQTPKSEADSMRQCRVEIDKTITTDWPPSSVDHQGQAVSLRSAYETAGVNLLLEFGRDDLPLPIGNEPFDLGLLHNYMVANRRTDVGGWNAHVLIVPRIEYPSGVWTAKPLGVMYDFRSNDLNALPREGCAMSFQKVGDSPLQYMRTLIHELGHVFNLLHPKHETPPQPIGTEIMNQTMDLQALGTYPDNISFDFIGRDRKWLAQGPSEFVRPGGEPFASRPEDAMDLAVDLAQPTTEGLEFTVSTREDRYMIGEPIELRMSLRCVGDEPIKVAADFCLHSGVVEVRLTSPTNRQFAFRPCYAECRDLHIHELAPGQELLGSSSIFFGAGGHVFVSPGEYQVLATYHANVDGTLVHAVSKSYTLTVGSPASEADIELSDLLMGPSQALFMVLRGGSHLRQATERLTMAIQKFGASKAAQGAKLSLAADVIRRAKGRTDLLHAEELLTSMDNRHADYEQRAEKSSLLASICRATGNSTGAGRELDEFRALAERCVPGVPGVVDDAVERVGRF